MNLDKIYRYLTRDIWRITNEEMHGGKRWLVNAFKAVFLSVRFFTGHRTMERASALTFYTLLALVPALALLLGIGRGFGLQDLVDAAIRQNMQGQEAIVDYLSQFADSYLLVAKSSVIMGVGVVMLFSVVYSLLGNIENVFNEIWQQKQGRETVRKITDYISIIVFLPALITLSAGTQIFLQTYIQTDLIHYSHELSEAAKWMLRWIPYLVTILMLTFLYIVIPHCKVKFLNALTGAIVAGSVFFAFQWLYISGQIWMTKYNAIYGSFAALPLFLLWVQVAWTLCLYGAELSYATQNISNYNYENLSQDLSRQDRDFLLVLIAAHIYRCRSLEREAPNTEELSIFFHLPSRITGELVSELADLKIIHEKPSDNPKKPNGWAASNEGDRVSVASLYDTLNTTGHNSLKVRHADFFSKEWQTIESMRQAAMVQGQTLLLRDIPTERFSDYGIKPSATAKVKDDEVLTNKPSKKK